MPSEKLPEVWLRGPLPDVSPLLMPAAHCLMQCREEIATAADLTASLGLATRAALAVVVTGVYVVAGAIAAAVVVAVTGNAAVVPLALVTAIAVALMTTPSLGRLPAQIVVRAIVATAVAVIWLGWLGATGAVLAVVTGFVAVLS